MVFGAGFKASPRESGFANCRKTLRVAGFEYLRAMYLPAPIPL
jgi:phenylalanine-4-hydroxylase